MQFNPSLLREQSAKAADKFVLEDSVNEQKESFLYDLLEFNDTMHKIDVEEKINYYRVLAEYSVGNSNEIVLQEDVIKSIRDFLTKAIRAIRDLFNRFIKFIKGKTGHEVLSQIKPLKAEFDSIKKDVRPGSSLDKTKELKVFVRPNITSIAGRINGSIRNLATLLDNVFENRTPTQDDIRQQVKLVYAVLKKTGRVDGKEYSGDVTNSEEFRKYINEYSLFIEKKSMRVVDYLDNGNYFDDANINIKAAEKEILGFTSELDRMEKRVNTKAATMDPKDRDIAIAIITSCKDIFNDVLWYFNAIIDMNIRAAAYWIKVYKSVRGVQANESGMIHGEEFNSDTLFDNDDVRDFNRTEWLDLELATECYELSSAILEYRRKVAVNEAMIIAENGIDTFRKLVAMQEAEANKLGDKFMEIIQTIAMAVDKFFANLKDKLSLNANFVKKNRDIIEGKPIKFPSVKSNGDILNGLDRVQSKTNLVPYNYETMKDSLNDKRTFFHKHIEGKLTGKLREGADWNNSKMSVEELCKAYFGASFPEDKLPKVSMSASDIQGKINSKDITKFLEAPNALMANIRSELTSLKSQAQRVASEKEMNNSGTNNTDTSKGDQPPTNTESDSVNNANKDFAESMYYSELYQRWFTEADIQRDPNDKNQNNDNNNTGNKQNGSNSKDGFKIYLDAYRAVLLAKLTGAGFVRSELMAIIKEHVREYDPKRVTEEDNSNESKEQPPKEEPANN